MSYSLPVLPYGYDDLEPYFDKKTMKIHHTKHHKTYVENSNSILSDLPEFQNIDEEILIQNLEKIPKKSRIFLRNNLGGHINHSIFWTILKKNVLMSENMKSYIEKNFGSIEDFKNSFFRVSLKHFGSGWTWLILNKDGSLEIVSTSNQDNPLMKNFVSCSFGYPLLCLDIWEHAYYLKYQNRRDEYIRSFWNLINWLEVERRLLYGKSSFVF